MTILRTERLLLRPVRAEDLPSFVAFYADPQVMSVRKYGVLDRETAQTHVQVMLDHWENHGYGMWVVTDNSDGSFAGECGIRWQKDSPGDPDGPDIELSYGLSPLFRQRGLATEAARAVIDHARVGLKLGRVAAVARADNSISHRILEKLGMTLIWRSEGREPPLVKYALEFR